MSTEIGGRLQKLREATGLKQKDFAAELGVSASLIAMVETGKQGASARLSRLLSERFNVNSDWLLNGTGPMLRDPEPGFVPSTPGVPRVTPPDRAQPLTGDFQLDGTAFNLIKCYDIEAAAGGGRYVPHEDANGAIAVSRHWLTKRGISADMAGIIQATGMSMEPLIPDGASMLVSFAVTPPYKPAIYIFRHDEALYVKHVTVLDRDNYERPARLFVTSNNPAFPPYEINVEPDVTDFRIIAIVKAVLSDL